MKYVPKWVSLALVLPVTLIWSVASHPAVGQTPGTADDGLMLSDLAKAKFQQGPGMPSCTSFGALRGDISKGPGTLVVRMKPGCTLPYHWHTPSEELVILQGTYHSQMQGQAPVDLKPGSYIQMLSHHVHRGRCVSKTDCIVFLVEGGALDTHYLDASGKETSLAEALRVTPRSFAKMQNDK